VLERLVGPSQARGRCLLPIFDYVANAFTRMTLPCADSDTVRDQNGAKLRKVWDRSSPRRWLEDSDAQGFNPDLYRQFVGREAVAQRHYRLSGKASLAGANKIQAGSLCYFTPSRGCRRFAEIAPGCPPEIARHSVKQCSIGFQPVLFAPSSDVFQVASVSPNCV
jgi:hypothetical protein